MFRYFKCQVKLAMSLLSSGAIEKKMPKKVPTHQTGQGCEEF